MITRIFILILGLQTLLELIIGVAMLLDFPSTVETGFQLEYTENMALFGTVMGLQLLFLSVMMIFAMVLTRQGKKSGIAIGIAVGLYFSLFGLLAFALHGNVEAIYIDSIRGIITVVLGFLAFRELEKKS